jgi:hypothetical protein
LGPVPNIKFSLSKLLLMLRKGRMEKTKKAELGLDSQFEVGLKFSIFFAPSEFLLALKETWMGPKK